MNKISFAIAASLLFSLLFFLFEPAFACSNADAGGITRCLTLEREVVRVRVDHEAVKALNKMHVFFLSTKDSIFINGDTFTLEIHLKTTRSVKIVLLRDFLRKGDAVQVSVSNTDGSLNTCYIAGARSEVCSRKLWIGR